MLSADDPLNPGYWYYPVDPASMPYDKAYIRKYEDMAGKPMGVALNEARVGLVKEYYSGKLVTDIGVGDGAFMLHMQTAGLGLPTGYDVNPEMVRQLQEMGWWVDATCFTMPVATFWDSLEHIQNPRTILDNVTHLAFVSLPIFISREHVLRSKHYRPTEHFHYWTFVGFVNYMESAGFELLEYNRMETDLGREDIGTFVFKRAE